MYVCTYSTWGTAARGAHVAVLELSTRGSEIPYILVKLIDKERGNTRESGLAGSRCNNATFVFHVATVANLPSREKN